MKHMDQIIMENERAATFERLRTDDFHEARCYLNAAKLSLQGQPRPWMNDCISDSIDAINDIVQRLQSPSQLP